MSLNYLEQKEREAFVELVKTKFEQIAKVLRKPIDDNDDPRAVFKDILASISAVLTALNASVFALGGSKLIPADLARELTARIQTLSEDISKALYAQAILDQDSYTPPKKEQH